MSNIIAGKPPSTTKPHFYLSTAMVLMLATSLLLWLNLHADWRGASRDSRDVAHAFYWRGWPETMLVKIHVVDLKEVEFQKANPSTPPASNNPSIRRYVERSGMGDPIRVFHWPAVAINALVAVTMLGALTYLSCATIAV